MLRHGSPNRRIVRSHPLMANEQSSSSGTGMPPVDASRALALAQQTFDIEAGAVLGLKTRTGETFVRAVQLMLAVRGREIGRAHV